MPSLGATFGRGAATTAQWDVANADCVVIMGSNMAENHPIAFRFVLQAKEQNGATIIHADPRFTRTSALADIYAPVRAGSRIHLPARTVHCLENTGRGVMRVVAVFRPAGSPAAAYYPDGTPAYAGAPPVTAS